MSSTNQLYQEYKNRLQKIADIKYAAAVLQWDQETYLPIKGNEARSRQIATLSELAHEQFTAEKTESLLLELLSKNDLDERQKRNVELSWYDYQKNKKLPSGFVRKSTEAINNSFHSWISARKENSFAKFEKPLQEVIDLKKEEAALLGYSDHPYNALMNDYDTGLTVAFTDNLFSKLIPPLSALLNQIRSKTQVNNDFLFKHFDKKRQWDFGVELLKNMHFDFEAGRQDTSEHPFTTNFSSEDVRVTTRIDENDLGNMTWSCIHEGGHALYEQGLPKTEYGLPLGEYCSLSIHESQSRLWENCIGRSKSYWKYHFPILQSYFPSQFEEVNLDSFYCGINKVTPSLIRTEADELTYHFHVLIRYEIEKKLIEGSIESKDIPCIWNEYYEKYLGVVVPDDKRGCLQDVHWSHGSFGYFATYSIGSLYAAQLWNSMNKQHANIIENLKKGDTRLILNWLQHNIFSFGRFYSSDNLCQKATGESLSAEHFINYANMKYHSIYDL